MSRGRAGIKSALLEASWTMPGLGGLRLSIPGPARLNNIDRTWPKLRDVAAPNSHWNWLNICSNAKEAFLLSANEGEAAVWTSRGILQIEGAWYCLDYMEVRPDLRGSRLGAFALATVASRAIEAGADGLLLASLPSTLEFYVKAGGSNKAPKRWKFAKDLVPVTFTRGAVLNLKELLDGYLDES